MLLHTTSFINIYTQLWRIKDIMVHKIVHKVWVYDFLTIYNVWLCSSEVGNMYIIRNCLLISIHVETMHAAHMLNSLITLLMLQNCSHSKLLPHNICSTQVYSVFTEIIVIRFHVPPRFLDTSFFQVSFDFYNRWTLRNTCLRESCTDMTKDWIPPLLRQ